MKQKKMLSLTLSQIRQLYCQELPELTAMAQQSLDDTDFKNHLARVPHSLHIRREQSG